jgi:sulfide dehydrogenase [flavocytochrome c] flavoprotein subunit
MTTTRRQFLKTAGATGAGTALLLSGCAGMEGGSGGKVVVIGGGFGGATAARYVKMWSPNTDVTLIEPQRAYATCPFSNYVLGGIMPLGNIIQGYGGLTSAGVKMVHEMATAVDTGKKTVTTAAGTLPYDRLIVAPGIDFIWDGVPGYSEAASEAAPHAWKAGTQTTLLAKQLEAMSDGGVVVIAVPRGPFRCPPGPYERASMIAWYLKNKKPRSTVIVVDPADGFAKQGLFLEGWKKHYGDMIKWVPGKDGGKVERVDVAVKTVKTEGETIKAAVMNIIPPQRASAIARTAGVADNTGWCPIDPLTFESKLVKGVHVVGDATIAAPMPKSGTSANTQAKIAAAAVVEMLAGRMPTEQVLSNTCYSLVTPDWGISVTAVYNNSATGITSPKDSGGVSPAGRDDAFRKQEAAYTRAWYAGITRDTWG